MNAETADVILYTDGACSGNPGPGGWAAILENPKTGKIGSGSAASEAMAALRGFRRWAPPN